MRPRALMAAIFVAHLACAVPAAAQVAAAISGVVTDPSGATVASADVSAKQVDTGTVRETTTDGAGRYRLVELPVGAYVVSRIVLEIPP